MFRQLWCKNILMFFFFFKGCIPCLENGVSPVIQISMEKGQSCALCLWMAPWPHTLGLSLMAVGFDIYSRMVREAAAGWQEPGLPGHAESISTSPHCPWWSSLTPQQHHPCGRPVRLDIQLCCHREPWQARSGERMWHHLHLQYKTSAQRKCTGTRANGDASAFLK